MVGGKSLEAGMVENQQKMEEKAFTFLSKNYIFL